MKRILLLISLLALGAPTFAVTPQSMPPPVTTSTKAPAAGAASGAGQRRLGDAGQSWLGGAGQSWLGGPSQSWLAGSGIHARLRRPGCCEVVDEGSGCESGALHEVRWHSRR